MNAEQSRLSTHTVLLWLVLVACLVVDLVVLSVVVHQDWPELPGVIGLGLALAQVSLLVAWLIWGTWNIVWRVVATSAATCALSVMAAGSVDDFDEAPEWFGILLFYVAMVATVLFISRWMGYRVTVDTALRDDAPQRRWQFSIWSLLSVMTAVGVLLGLLRLVEWPGHDLVEAILFFLILTTTTCLVFFVSFLGGESVWRWLIAAATILTLCPLAGLLMALTGFPPHDDWRELMAMNTIQGATIVGIVSALRTGGLCLARLSTEAASMATPTAKTLQLKPSPPPAEP